jgi:hypothetical protein
MTFLTEQSQEQYTAFEQERDNRKIAKGAIKSFKRKRAFVEIDILQAVMDGNIPEAERLAAGMTRDDRAELRDHLRTAMVILNEADEKE